MKRSLLITALLVLIGLAVWFLRQLLRPAALPPKPRTVEQVLRALDASVDRSLRPVFSQAGVSYPPERLTLLAFKAEKRLEVYAPDREGKMKRVTSYPVLAASGMAGPKLQEGDRQVPEGFYRIVLLNPNSSYHLSLRVDYPNAEDIARAKEEGRDTSNLGSDIMIHGGAGSSGCLAIGDPAVEEIFGLVAKTGLDHTELVIAPWDFRSKTNHEIPPNAPAWTGALHGRLREVVESLP